MVKKEKRVQAKSVKVNSDIEQVQQDILEQLGEQPHRKKPAKYRKPAEDTQFQLEIAVHNARNMGRFILY